MVPSNIVGLVDGRKLGLLEGRLGRSPTNGLPLMNLDTLPIPSSSISGVQFRSEKENSVSTVLDNLTSPGEKAEEVLQQPKPMAVAVSEVIVVDSDSQHSQSNSLIGRITTKDLTDQLVGAKRIRSEDDSHSQLTHGDSMEGSVDRGNLRLKLSDDDNNSPNLNGDNGSRGAAIPKRTIVSYFTAHAEPAHPTPLFPSSAAAPAAETAGVAKASGSSSSAAKASSKKDAAAAATNVPTNATINDLKKQLEQARQNKDQAELKAQRVESEMKDFQAKTKAAEEKNTKMCKALEEVHRRMAMQEFRRKRDRLALDCVRLGKITSVRTSATAIGEVWEDGYAWKEILKRSAELLERKEELESRKRKVNNMKRQAKKASTDDIDAELNADLDLATENEAVKIHAEQLKKDETALAEERRLLESEKAIHQKELRRCQCEERSRFYRDLPLLHDRYLLQLMLGRGGFSEVWKALDLVELREVAVKVHQLNPQWGEERKSSYIRHVTREYNIHKDMKHPRVVQLFDVFEIDVNSFATVLEYCTGIDLDEKLKRHRTIPEKDAKVIFMQILSGLRYLDKPYSSEDSTGNTKKTMSIIHYDLKPANILFDESDDVKITDFGLSKVLDEANEGTSMELTSQGAGTYWYLPPECFVRGGAVISTKVDIWSAGVIFYQMLYGVRPFGEGKTQENVWSENIIFNSSQVEFPSDPKAPKVPDEAKDLIRACLTRDPKIRPDVMAVCQHPYLTKSK